jgi:SAM-dependent methyltransferase
VTVSPDEARAVALSLPEAVEQDHHGRPSFRVGGKIFATLWSDERMNVMLDEGGILTAIDTAPGACEQVWWGKRLAAVGITLSRVDRQVLGELLTDAWEQKAPRRLLTDGEATKRHKDTLDAFGLGDEDLAAWRESGLPDEAFVEWLVDRVARRPTGSSARQVYGADDVHDFARRAILDALALGPADHLLEVGCGGGLLLRDALVTGASVTGLDHSEEMVVLARERAPGADVVLGKAERLPFADGTFSAIAMSVVFFFLEDPVGVLRECRRVLRRGGRVAVYTTGPELRGTPAAPEPIASEGHFYADHELAELARRAQLREVSVRNERGGQLLTARA